MGTEFKGTSGEWKLARVDDWPFGFRVTTDVADREVILSQDAIAFASGQKTRAACMAGVGFREPERTKVVAMLQEQEANMKLFSASKDLLEALKRMLIDGNSVDENYRKLAVNQARSAIAKALT